MSWESLLGRQVRVYSGADVTRTDPPVAEGEVIGVCMVPSLVVRASDGTTSQHATSLPLEVMEWKPL